MFTPPPKESKITYYNELKKSQENLIDLLMEVSKVPIPKVYPSKDNTSYTYINYFGMSPEESIITLVANYRNTKKAGEMLEQYVVTLKDPKTLQDFKDALAGHLQYPQYYPNVTAFIREREELHTKFEPLATKLRAQLDDYQKLLLFEIAANESEQIKSLITQIKEEKKAEGNAPSLQTLALNQLLDQYLEKPGIQKEMDKIHKAIIDEVIKQFKIEYEEKNNYKQKP